MNPSFRTILPLALLLLMTRSRAEEPAAEVLLKPTRLTLITAGSDLAPVFADIEKQSGNKLLDETQRFGQSDPLPAWNFSLSDRDFWPLLDKFLDAADLEPINNASGDGLPIGRRPQGMLPRYGQAFYEGPFRLDVTRVSSQLGMRYGGDHRASIELEVSWEPRLRPLYFSQSVNGLQMIADETTPVTIAEGTSVLSVEASRDSHAVELHLPLQLPQQQLNLISSLKGRIKALVATRTAEFRFHDLAKANSAEQIDGGVKVVLVDVRENQGLTELHMRLEFDESLPATVAQGSWNFQNPTYLENAAGERLEHSGFETTTQGERILGLAFYFDVPEGKLSNYIWVYQTPAEMVEVPIEYELKDIQLP